MLLVSVVGPIQLAAQQIPVAELKPANGVVTDSSMGPAAVRELDDGRVVIPRGREGMAVADFRKGIIEKVESAPGGRPVRLAGDSTLLEVSGTGWVILEGTRMLGMLPSTNPVVALATPLYGVSRAGAVLAVTGGQPRADSASVFLVDRATGSKEFITKVWQGTPAMGGVPAPTYVVTEQPVLAFDGWIAVVRAHPYRVDWRSPDGRWLLGAPLPVAPVKMDTRERIAYYAHWNQQPPGGPLPADWPALVEPFTYPGPIATPDGKVIVLRTWTADYPGGRYDVINRHGELEWEFALSKETHEQVAGFGPSAIYTISAPTGRPPFKLERHPWP
jgi:hypothetical protein